MATNSTIDRGCRRRRLGIGVALAGVLLATGCGVKSAPTRPGDYPYPAAYPTDVDDPIVPAGDAPTLQATPTPRSSRDDERRRPAARDDTPAPATELIVR